MCFFVLCVLITLTHTIHIIYLTTQLSPPAVLERVLYRADWDRIEADKKAQEEAAANQEKRMALCCAVLCCAVLCC